MNPTPKNLPLQPAAAFCRAIWHSLISELCKPDLNQRSHQLKVSLFKDVMLCCWMSGSDISKNYSAFTSKAYMTLFYVQNYLPSDTSSNP